MVELRNWKIDCVFLERRAGSRCDFFIFYFGVVPVSNLLNVQRENVCMKKTKKQNRIIKEPSSGESVTLSRKNCCACHVQSHLCIPHTCKLSIYCVRPLGLWRWNYPSNLRYQVSVYYSVTNQALYLQSSLTLLIWMCVKDEYIYFLYSVAMPLSAFYTSTKSYYIIITVIICCIYFFLLH